MQNGTRIPTGTKGSNGVIASVDIRNKTFADDPKSAPVLSHLRFDVQDQEFLGILGPSGCGKTTLLRLIAGIDVSYEGSIIVDGRPVERPDLGRGLVFQESRLLPWYKVLQNVAFALPRGTPKALALQKSRDALKRVGFGEDGSALPYQLSGGMTKRVALARAIVNIPKMLLLDEPFAALDEPSKYALQDEIANIHTNEKDMTVLLVTHDVEEAVYLSDRLVILSQKPSRVLKEIPIHLKYPRDRLSKEFRGICNSVTESIFEDWWKSASQSKYL